MKDDEVCAGLYIRLSQQDDEMDGKTESNSISNQTELLVNYCNARKWRIEKIYKDDGYSGTSFKTRPAFMSLIDDVKNGKINTVIVKDTSRFGRNKSESDNYLKLFRAFDVRFIAVYDGYDTDVNPDDMGNDIKRTFDEHYSKDLSKKIKSSLRIKAISGTLKDGRAPYGYQFSKNDKIVYEEDPDTIDNLRLIFKMALNNKSTGEIASFLKEKKVFCPSYYMFLKYGFYGKKFMIINDEKKYNWTANTVRDILKNPSYTGDVIHYRKVKRLAYNNKTDSIYKKTVNNKDVITTFNAAPVIVSKEEHEELVNGIRTVKRSHLEFNMFPGMMYCGDCGHLMRFKKERNGKKYPQGYYYYICDKSKKHQTDSDESKGCGGHYVMLKTVEGVVHEMFKKDQAFFRKHKDELLHAIDSVYFKKKKILSIPDDELQKLQKELAENQKKAQLLWSEYSKGIFAESTFRKLADEVKSKIENLETKINAMTLSNTLEFDKEQIKRTLDLLCNLSTKNAFTRENVQLIIKRIYVYQNSEKKISFKIQYAGLTEFMELLKNE